MTSAHTITANGMLSESLRKPFLSALSLHLAIVGALVLYAWWGGSQENFGARDAGGASVGITPVSSIPLRQKGPENPVAEDTKSTAPQEAAPEKPQPKPKVKEPDPEDAVSLDTKKMKQEKPPPPPKFKPFNEIAPNQVTVKAPQAASSPMFTQLPGAGQINTGGDTTLGEKFGDYSGQIQRLIATEWSRTTRDVDASLKTAPTVIATFELMRNGSKRNIRILQSSGNLALDTSVRRAIEDSRLPELPVKLNKDSVLVEFQFKLKR